MGGQRLVRVKELREVAGISQQALATAAGVSKQHESDLENNKSGASPDVAWAIAEALAQALANPAAIHRAITHTSDGGAA